MPTAVPIQCVEATTPKVPSISGRVVNGPCVDVGHAGIAPPFAVGVAGRRVGASRRMSSRCGVCRDQTLASTFAATTLRGGEGSDPFSANSDSLAASFRSRVWGGGAGRSGCARRPLDLLPGDWAEERPARLRPHLPGRLLGQFTDLWPSTDFGFAASGPRIEAWMVCPPCQARYPDYGPRPVLRGGLQCRRASHLRGTRR